MIEHLSVEIGPRLAGTEGSRLAAEYIAELMDSIGLEVRLQPFTYVGWSYECMPRLNVVTPVEESIVCAPRAYTAASPGPITGRVWRDGYISVIPDLFGFERLAVGEAGERQASILISPTPGLPPWSFPDTDLRFREPALHISSEDGARLLRLLDEGEVTVRIETFGHDLPNVTDSNVIGFVEGSNPDRVVVGSHYDSVWNSPGATDNASGVAVMLETAQRVVANPMDCNAEFIAFAAEECWLFGSHYFVREAQFRDEIDIYKGMVNCDPLGPGDLLECWVGPDELKTRVSDILNELRIPDSYSVEWRQAVDGSDHYPFWLAGVPACFPIWMPHTVEYHQPSDTMEHVKLHKLEITMEIVEAVARNLASNARITI